VTRKNWIPAQIDVPPVTEPQTSSEPMDQVTSEQRGCVPSIKEAIEDLIYQPQFEVGISMPCEDSSCIECIRKLLSSLHHTEQEL